MAKQWIIPTLTIATVVSLVFVYRDRPVSTNLEKIPRYHALEHNVKQEAVNTSSFVTANTSHSYALALTYNGQQGSGLTKLLQLQCVVGTLGLSMYIVEPFVRASRLVSRPNGAMSFREYFDVTRFNVAAISLGYAELATWKEFLQNAPRNVVLLKITGFASCVEDPTTEDIARTSPQTIDESHTECLSDPRLSELNKEGFCLVRIVHQAKQYGTSMILTSEEMYRDVFGKWKPEDVTLVIDSWCPSWYVERSTTSPCTHSGGGGHLAENLLPSQKLLNQAAEFKATHFQGRFLVAVMMRVEKLILKRGVDIGDCLSKLDSLVEDLKSNHSQSQTFVTADIGEYGSGSWNHIGVDKIRNELQKLFQEVKSTIFALANMTFDKWEDSFTQATGGIEDSGYVAALQRTIAARADCIVFLSWGTFQRVALFEYLSNHPDPATWCIHSVCPDRGHYESIVQQRQHQYTCNLTSTLL